jgi:hypothetical protein
MRYFLISFQAMPKNRAISTSIVGHVPMQRIGFPNELDIVNEIAETWKEPMLHVAITNIFEFKDDWDYCAFLAIPTKQQPES